MQGGIAVLDFGSQFTQLIARRLRELGVYSEIYPYNVDKEKLIKFSPKGIILSGGPSSVHDEGAPVRDISELSAIAPILGVCYGMQLIAHVLGGRVQSATQREYGLNRILWSTPLAKNLALEQNVWMSHGDVVEAAPKNFSVLAKSSTDHIAAISGSLLHGGLKRPIWGIQFHPEVSHTENGLDLLRAFVFDLCLCQADWQAPQIVEHLQDAIKAKVQNNEHILCGLSGGVDSTVTAQLLTSTLGKERVHCVFVDNGLLRENEFEEVLSNYKEMGLNIVAANASEQFLQALKGVSDPEKKRKIIGQVFIDVFDSEAKKIKANVAYLAQGTLYPDVIESVSVRGSSVTIKSHHNVGGLPEKMNLKLIEPLRELFKDEVRKIGIQLKIPKHLVERHPFPGPGLAIRIVGEVNKQDLMLLRKADAIYIQELKRQNLYSEIWQAFAVLLPIRTVGVMGDARTYDKVLGLRAVRSLDGMTADWYPFEFAFLRHVSNRITNECKGINRVVYDVTSKPPGTIEWE